MRAPEVLLALAITTLAGTAHAGDNELSLGSYNRALRTGSANAVTDDTLGGGTLAIGRALDLGLFPNLDVWATSAFSWGGADGSMFQTMTTEVDTIALTFGGRARYTVHRRVAVGARLDLGTARTGLTIHGNGHTVSDAAWGGTATAAATLDLLAIAHPAFALGLRVELGYVTMTAPSLSPRADQDDSKILLDEMQASIGGLDLGGRFMSFSVLSQF